MAFSYEKNTRKNLTFKIKGRLDNSTGGSSLNSPLAERNESSAEGRKITRHKDTETNTRRGIVDMHIGQTVI